MRVLVAEDDQASGKFLSKLLTRYGEVVLTTDGIQAVDTFVAAASEKNFFDLVCLDIMMDIKHWLPSAMRRESSGSPGSPDARWS